MCSSHSVGSDFDVFWGPTRPGGTRRAETPPTAGNVAGHTPRRVTGAVEEPHHRAKLVRTCQAREVQSRDRGFEVGREDRCLLYGAHLRQETLAEKRQGAESETVAGCSNDMIGRELVQPAICPLQMQQGARTAGLRAQ